jgi:addiction module RelE/StbE family toxin
MVELIWDDPFIKNVRKWLRKHPEMKIRFEERIHLFAQEPFHPSLKTHNLSGKLNNYWAFSITHDYRLVFKFLSSKKVLLIDIGSHKEVY